MNPEWLKQILMPLEICVSAKAGDLIFNPKDNRRDSNGSLTFCPMSPGVYQIYSQSLKCEARAGQPPSSYFF